MIPLVRKFIMLTVVTSCAAVSFAQQTAADLQNSANQNVSPEVLRKGFGEQLKIAESKFDYATELAVSKAWNKALSEDKVPKDKLLLLLANAKKYDSVVVFDQPHFDAPDERYAGQLKRALDLYFSGRDEEVWSHAERILKTAQAENVPGYIRFGKGATGWSPFRANSAALGLAGGFELQARVLLRRGDFRNALSAANDGIDAARAALGIVKEMPPNEQASAATFQSKEALASLLIQKIRAQMANGSTNSAVRTLDEYLPLAREVEVHPRYYWNIAVARYNQRDFDQSERYFRKADAAAKGLGYPELSFFRSDCGQGIVGSLEGQRKWREVQLELDRIDALAGEDETLKYRVRYRFERGYSYVHNGVRLEEAIGLMTELGTNAKDGLFAAHASGLSGVAMWRLKKDPGQGLALLKQAVQVYMKPIYFDDQALGLSTDVRDLVIETYMEAVFETVGEDPAQALGPAEWIRSSTVQGALADAAARSAANDPALAELVRRDQDLKNEIKNLRTKAAVETDASVSAQINDLNILRSEIEAQIVSKFPEYAQLVKPTPPNLDLVSKELAPDEVMVLLLPTDQSVFVWTIESDGKKAAVRSDLGKADLSKLVKRLRGSLDFAEMNGSLRSFDRAAAYEIYNRLLAPVQSSLNGKKHLVVAAGGVLGQIPFGVLLSKSVQTVNKDAPFLIKQMAISHVPNLNSWLAVKHLSQTKRANEALIAWGDPSFSSVSQPPSDATKNFRSVGITRTARNADSDQLIEKGALRYVDIPQLPETRAELIAIAKALQANATDDLHLGTNATRASVLKSNSDGELARKKVVAFATHGLMAGDLPNLKQPALALANTTEGVQNPLDPLLTLEDVLSMKLNADWVILSACNTAAADGKADEALSGLARGFFYAGSRSLLVTHWAVESESARELTIETMKNYMANPMQRKAESLRQAMLTVMAEAQYKHPAYWAPYALVGDGGR